MDDIHQISISCMKFGGWSGGCVRFSRRYRPKTLPKAIFNGVHSVPAFGGGRMKINDVPDFYSRRDLAAFDFDNSQKRLRIIEIFCWTRTASSEILGHFSQ